MIVFLHQIKTTKCIVSYNGVTGRVKVRGGGGFHIYKKLYIN